MKFTRINETTVNCIITSDDMDEQGLTYEDLFQKRDEAMLFLHEVIQRAAEEVDYQPKGAYLPMQIAVLPDHSVSVTLSEDGSSALSDMLKSLTDRIRSFLEEVLPDEMKDQFRQGVIEAEVSRAEQAKRIGGPVKYTDYVFSFDSIRTAAFLAATLPDAEICKSSLYKGRDGRYYLIFTISEGDSKAFAAVFMRACEYGEFVSVEQRQILHIEESEECLLKDNALETLRKM